ncbi:helix-turn-helix domain-containing protein [Nitrospirillum viridazoti]|uniref:helix-turn-helix domain-containing protein n=1 Tax=Nitrospirillum viridazoti TaxID=3144925 RepID=UPI001642F828|nr:helix-turn-helix transcriptional regulator [Nitrospirillum amazonense]
MTKQNLVVAQGGVFFAPGVINNANYAVTASAKSAYHAEMDVKARVATRIKAIRKRRGLSQEALAALIGRSPDAISNLERGVSSLPYDTLDLLAKGLDVPLSELFLEESGDPSRAEAVARLTDAARQLDDQMLATAVAIVELLVAGAGKGS